MRSFKLLVYKAEKAVLEEVMYLQIYKYILYKCVMYYMRSIIEKRPSKCVLYGVVVLSLEVKMNREGTSECVLYREAVLSLLPSL